VPTFRPLPQPQPLPAARSALAGLFAVLLAQPLQAQRVPGPDETDGAAVPERAATELDAIQVTGLRQPLSRFPGAATVLDAGDLQDGQRQASLAEPLQRAPGVLALERNNFAQDLQVQSRGFGARSTFGIRGIQLVVDGVPATALDGQGQASSFALGALDRMEVVRGPLALQYGNAAGGAILGHSELGGTPGWRAQAWAGSDAASRLSLRADGAAGHGALRWRAHGAWLRADGHRPHSAAERTHVGAVAQWRPAPGHELRLVADVLEQPFVQDPLGIGRAQWQADPHGTDPAAITFDTRKRVTNRQAGAHWTATHAGGHETWLAPHGVQRRIVQYLAIPPSAQAAPSSAGGVIELDRSSAGVGLGHRRALRDGAIAFGLDAGRLREDRRGYENFDGTRLGVRGRLRRDEVNTVRSREGWIAGEWRPTIGWTVLGAVRRSWLDFASDDHYVAPGNIDDSGGLRFAQNATSLGVARALGNGELFAGIGRGFETPTVVELAYRPDGMAGFNATLRPARFATAELGLRWRGEGWRGSVAAWWIDGRGEIVPALNAGGRTSFANASATRRHGVEASLDGSFGERWTYALVGNALRAEFEDGFTVRVVRGGQVETREVHAGNRVPGIPALHGFAELAWHPRDPFAVALEATGNSSIPVDDSNSDAAPGHVRMALALRWRSPRDPGWHAFVRIDNLADRDAVGSVIVNEANGRAFEPLPARGFTLGLGWAAGL
jgi:iron complex outermembrane recepter protein